MADRAQFLANRDSIGPRLLELARMLKPGVPAAVIERVRAELERIGRG